MYKNRIIKFRAWDKTNKAWIYSSHQSGLTWFFDMLETGGFDYKLQQFTGLLDSKGKEIYEGDILKIYIEKDLQNNSYIVKNMLDFYFDCHREDHYLRISQKEIIGNIFENPELLK
ncbi:MAG: YopX family protein [Nanoarchaeota archaeon]